LAEKAFRLDAKEVLKIVGEFFSCPFSPVLGFSHWKAKIGWLCGTRRMQKNASLRSRQVKIFALAGTRPKSVYGFGTTGCNVTVTEFTACRSWSGLKSSVPDFWTGSKGVFQDD
jgi:hypothetical protein